MFIIRTFPILLLTNPITADIANFKKTGTEPEVTPFNETHVEIDYRKSVTLESDFSQIKEIIPPSTLIIITHLKVFYIANLN